MKKIRFFYLIFLVMPILLAASNVKAESKLKIGYVNMNKAINTSQEGQRSKKFLEAQANRTKQLLSEKEQAVVAKENELKNNIMLNKDAMDKKRAELEQMKKALREEVAKAQNSFRQDEARHTTKIFNDLVSVVNQIAKDENFDLILEYNIKQTILYSKFDMIDITDKVTKEYDKLQAIQ